MLDFLSHQIMTNLDAQEKATLFSLLTDHVDIVEKLIPGAPLINYIKYNDAFADPIVAEYESWKSKR
jgi:hypothetical protein